MLSCKITGWKTCMMMYDLCMIWVDRKNRFTVRNMKEIPVFVKEPAQLGNSTLITHNF